LALGRRRASEGFFFFYITMLCFPHCVARCASANGGRAGSKNFSSPRVIRSCAIYRRRIRFNPESIQWAVFWMAFGAKNSRNPDGNRLNLGNFDENGLNCNNWWNDNRNDNLGVFGLMMKRIKRTAAIWPLFF
jgi:hypothetical protein